MEHRICLDAGLANTFSSHKGKVMAVAVCHGVKARTLIIRPPKLSWLDPAVSQKFWP